MIVRFLLVLLLSVPVVASAASMAIMVAAGTEGGGTTTPTYSSGSYSTDNGYGSTSTVAFTPQSGTNRCFIAFVSNMDTTTVSSINWDDGGGGEAAMTLVDTATISSVRASMYYHCTDSGTSQLDVAVTFSAANNHSVWVAQFDGCNTSSLIDTEASDTDSGNDPTQAEPSVTTGTDNSLLVSGVATYSTGITHSVCNTTGQTLFSDASGGAQTVNGGYFDLGSQGTKTQCFESDTSWLTAVAITGALKPNGS